MAAIAAEAPAHAESFATKLLRVLSKSPVHIVLLVVGLLWLVPTFGLFVTSLMAPADYNNFGWWKVLSHPSVATWQNYSQLLHHTDIPHALCTTVQIADILTSGRPNVTWLLAQLSQKIAQPT